MASINNSTVDDELGNIERDIRTLKIEFEQYFGGGRSRPPTDTQWRLETSLKRYADRTAELSSGQRFRYSNLASTYAKYQDMWRKKLIQKESGTTQHHYGAAAKAIQAERSRKMAVQQMQARAAETAGATVEEQAAVASKATAVAHAVADAARHAAETRNPAGEFSTTFSDPANDPEKVEKLYHRMVQARSETGEKAGVPSLKDFQRFVQEKTKDLRDKGGREIEYSVSIEGGRVKLKARVSN
ncbi:MAG: MXAN_5187 C-terminal domain-containing protein [Candidatus Acidiferrales bacterium]